MTLNNNICLHNIDYHINYIIKISYIIRYNLNLRMIMLINLFHFDLQCRVYLFLMLYLDVLLYDILIKGKKMNHILCDTFLFVLFFFLILDINSYFSLKFVLNFNYIIFIWIVSQFTKTYTKIHF